MLCCIILQPRLLTYWCLERSFANVTVDVGGTAIYSRNRYVSGFAKHFGLQPQAGDDGVNSDIGIWDGSKFRVQVDSDSRLDMGANVLFRYGFSPLRVIPAVRNAVDGFDKIYDLQEGQKSFETRAALLDALGVFNLTQTSAYDFFKSLGVEEKFVKEMVDGASRCNYNQPGKSALPGTVVHVELHQQPQPFADCGQPLPAQVSLFMRAAPAPQPLCMRALAASRLDVVT
ncbi:FLCY [Symbiodinium sp. CCMP2592]|nr:FLCY [Symbiodinium sp. CCMP2592]